MINKKHTIKLIKYLHFIFILLFSIGCTHATINQPLAFPIESKQFTHYYNQAPGVYEFYLKPEYQGKVINFDTQETKVPIKGAHFGNNVVTASLHYFELGQFELDGYLFKLIIYNRNDDSDIVLLNIQLNSYAPNGQLIDALLLDSRFGFEEFERFSEFTINQDVITIDSYITYITEVIDGGELGNKIENPLPQPFIQEEYQINNGIFKLMSRTEF
ncbi:hypothetical protein CUZ56_01336 [Saezia sanguinis]|uniref:Uncharacterized protein n=1 Tax=Saezia sanguinis TaxID=1965230 RepID=A0A433SF69_9BURK|nr:hypothetical protein [Saezia sanguinis]RUS67391.1 hypothetical protein CUZ56_01336 [Saezia sanguinis]